MVNTLYVTSSSVFHTEETVTIETVDGRRYASGPVLKPNGYIYTLSMDSFDTVLLDSARANVNQFAAVGLAELKHHNFLMRSCNFFRNFHKKQFVV